MAPPRDTAGSTTPHQQPQQADAGPGRYNQKATTLRNATAEAGWFYPTPALCKAGADVRGARAAREFFRHEGLSDVPARRQRGGVLPALPVRQQLHVRHGAS